MHAALFMTRVAFTNIHRHRFTRYWPVDHERARGRAADGSVWLQIATASADMNGASNASFISDQEVGFALDSSVGDEACV